ncbi:hypothetical protein NEOLEDRAFT_1068017 [Neolentinus lepideus HHB14362 ss-1]|uniref:BTB domain-containing protein n=1 Tax=Neolentinus lepideus HHB14362 ss-1 TaxID=1314782 RepID=A0A165RTB5_9AGAM|nr:hypothetical protein NEOLEDRAFT_1068017 [Neolentinus lepideus HHB14362 ss-1]
MPEASRKSTDAIHDGVDVVPKDGVTKSQDLWFDDGNIVLQAESTVFKVHRTVLALNSTVFRDMFGVAHPEDGEQLADCPLVDVLDKSDDMWLFLKAMYTPGYCETVVDFPQVASMLRLASKYDVKYFRTLSVAKLRTVCPTDFSVWNRNPAVSHPDKLLTLARECGIRILLPAAMYQCCLLGQDYIIDHVPAREDVKLCLTGRQKIIDAWRKMVDPTSEDGSIFRYSRSSCCQQQMRALMLEPIIWAIMLDSKIHVHDADALEKISSAAWQRLCVDCASSLRRNVEGARKVIWNKLPGFFGLPAWDELKKEMESEGSPN